MPSNIQPDAETQLEIYRRMALITQNDSAIRKTIRTGRLVTPYYSPKGQEAIPSAISVCLRSDDQIATIYRGVHDMLAKGIPLRELWAEQAGRETGACKGRGGPLHVSHPESGVMITTGIVGSSMPVANGLALAAQLDGSDRVVVAYFGDAASNIGAFHEALNMASLWKLPVVFVCQNNGFGEHTRYDRSTSARQISDRAVGYAMPGETIDGNDPFAVYTAARAAIVRARAGEGPSLIEAKTFRFYGHVMGDPDNYMDPQIKKAAMERDPTKLFREHLIASNVATDAQLAAMEEEIDRQVEDAIQFALSSDWPQAERVEDYVFAGEPQ